MQRRDDFVISWQRSVHPWLGIHKLPFFPRPVCTDYRLPSNSRLIIPGRTPFCPAGFFNLRPRSTRCQKTLRRLHHGMQMTSVGLRNLIGILKAENQLFIIPLEELEKQWKNCVRNISHFFSSFELLAHKRNFLLILSVLLTGCPFDCKKIVIIRKQFRKISFWWGYVSND